MVAPEAAGRRQGRGSRNPGRAAAPRSGCAVGLECTSQVSWGCKGKARRRIAGCMGRLVCKPLQVCVGRAIGGAGGALHGFEGRAGGGQLPPARAATPHRPPASPPHTHPKKQARKERDAHAKMPNPPRPCALLPSTPPRHYAPAFPPTPHRSASTNPFHCRMGAPAAVVQRWAGRACAGGSRRGYRGGLKRRAAAVCAPRA